MYSSEKSIFPHCSSKIPRIKQRYPSNGHNRIPFAVPWRLYRHRAFAWMAGRFHRLCICKYRIRQLTDPAIFSEPHFIRKMQALQTMALEAARKGTPFYVVLLPMLVDLGKGTFTPTYEGILRVLEANQIACFDLSRCLDGWHDRDAWIFPFDQHPNHRASEVFAESLLHEFIRRDVPDDLTGL